MKKVVATLVIALFATSAFAQFAPVPMVIDAPAEVEYSFDGSTLAIPVNVTGAPGNTVFAVYTKGKADAMPNVRNGFLGWHEVNKIDTCVYFNAGFELIMGSNTIEWNGKNQDGKQVVDDEYTYYIFAYDNLNQKILATSETVQPGWGENTLVDFAPDGTPLDNPYFISNSQGITDVTGFRKRNKWILGNEPTDDSFVESTFYQLAEGFAERSKIMMSRIEGDTDMFFVAQYQASATAFVNKLKWIPNGEAELQTEWGEAGQVSFSVAAISGWDANVQDLALVGTNTLIASNTSHDGNSVNELVMIDAADGFITNQVDLSEWWVRPEDEEGEGQLSSGPNTFDVVGDNLYMGAHSTCMNQMIAPLDGDDAETMNRWLNTNGDYIGDHNENVDAAKPWVCHDFNIGPYKYHIGADANGFSVFPTYDLGAVSFGLYGPDGTGIDYFAFAAEDADLKRDTQFLQNGSAFDGIYTDNTQLSADDSRNGYWFVAHDSVKGTISANPIAVEDDAPAAFAVAQNTPNPFNPTTTISFSIADAGQVDIDVFNVAGQKIDSIANEHLSAGNHTVTWNASGFAAGVYFYTVKSGSFSKTMKMTLLK